MSFKTECPKCASHNAFYQRTEYDLILRCLCGFHKVVATTLETVCIEHNDTGADIKLPKKGSNLHMTLVALAATVQSTSAELTFELNLRGQNFTVSDVASYLTILRSKGLVTTLKNRRGVTGGSTWAATDVCKELLGLN